MASLRGVLADVAGWFGAGGDEVQGRGSDVVVDGVVVVLWKLENFKKSTI